MRSIICHNMNRDETCKKTSKPCLAISSSIYIEKMLDCPSYDGGKK